MASHLECKTPKCAACIYGKATRKAWKTYHPPRPLNPKGLLRGIPGSMESASSITMPIMGALQITILLFAQHRWPEAISTHLWPYALRAANDSLNNSPRLSDKVLPFEAFSRQKTTMKKTTAYFRMPSLSVKQQITGRQILISLE
mmetsp:Transcript_24150/g.43630  ORF Transcript_24150/g.43630 Transcript_24150/m.43630 type:complete len:145 (-) Transcript_24150:400-834(-)